MKHPVFLTLVFSFASIAYPITPDYADSGNLPIISNVTILNIMGNVAEFRAVIVPNGSDLIGWFDWGTSPLYGHSTPPVSMPNPTGSWIDQVVAGLPPGSLIHFRPVGQNSSGVTFGPDSTFVTSGPLVPEPTTLAADSVTKTSAVLRGKLKLYGNAAQFTFTCGTPLYPGMISNILQGTASDTGEVEVSTRLDGLIPNTVYTYWLSSYAGLWFISGGSQTFVTAFDSSTKGLIVPLKVTTAENRWSIIRFGVHTAATDSIDRRLGEFELPPYPPPDAYESRFIGRFLNLGSYADIRRFSSESQVDTYKVRFQTGLPGYPVTIAWPDLADLYAGSVELRVPGDSPVDMKSSSSFSVTNTDVSGFTIIAADPIPVSKAPSVLTDVAARTGPAFSQLNASVNPNGLATTAWFEWGTSQLYGSVTPEQGVGNDAGTIPANIFVFGLSSSTIYHYRAVARNSTGTIYGSDQEFTTSAVTGVPPGAAPTDGFGLAQNFPNPWNPVTVIRYSLPAISRVSLKVFNVLGEIVAVLVDGVQNVGEKSVEWDGRNVPSGVYFYKLEASRLSDPFPAVTEVKKMVLIR